MHIDWTEIQQKLKALGFDPGPIDGIQGPNTDAAVVAFKKSVGLRARPYLGPITYEALMGQPETSSKYTPWMGHATRLRGLHEQRDRAVLMKAFGSLSWVNPVTTAWCGAFVAACHRMADPDVKLPENPLGARNWANWGQDSGAVYGATLVFWRVSPADWRGHVGYYWGEDSTHYHVLGGNQSDAVTVTRLSKSRLLAARFPTGVPVLTHPIRVAPGGVRISTNEA